MNKPAPKFEGPAVLEDGKFKVRVAGTPETNVKLCVDVTMCSRRIFASKTTKASKLL